MFVSSPSYLNISGYISMLNYEKEHHWKEKGSNMGEKVVYYKMVLIFWDKE
jgi:hypothetical protein